MGDALRHAKLIKTSSFNFVAQTKPEYFDQCAILSHRWRPKEITLRRYKEFAKAASSILKTFHFGDDFLRKDDSEVVQDLLKPFPEDQSVQISESWRTPDLTEKIEFEEVVQSEVQRLRSLNFTHYEQLAIAKILKFGFLARQDAYKYIWVDTCCINKEDHVAMEQGINSMWYYYSRSKHCYAFLNDVSMESSEWTEAIQSDDGRRSCESASSEDSQADSGCPLGDLMHSAWFTRGQSVPSLIREWSQPC